MVDEETDVLVQDGSPASAEQKRDWSQPAPESEIQTVREALEANEMRCLVVDDLRAAREAALQIIPEGAEVFTSTSVTVDESGLARELDDSGRYVSIRRRLQALPKERQSSEGRILTASPPYVTGSVHAITHQGQLVVASRSGSQVPLYAYTAQHVVLLVGAQKIVSSLADALRRLEEHSLPLEDQRARKAYGVGSGINKVLINNREFSKGRTTVVLIRSAVGF